MLPKYQKFAEDLKALSDKIKAIRDEFNSSISDGMKGNKYKPQYDQMVSSFEEIEASLAVINDSASTAEARDAAWDKVADNLAVPESRLPSPSEYSKSATDEVNANLENDNFRRLWRTSKKLAELSFETDYMKSKSDYNEIENDLNAYDAENRKYKQALYSFNEKLNYRGPADMYNQRENTKKLYTENEKKYNDMVADDTVGKLQKEYSKISIDTIQITYQINDQIRELDKQLDEVDNAIQKTDDQIREVESNADNLKKDLAENTEKINEKYARLNVIQTREIEISETSVKYQEMVGQFREDIRKNNELIDETAKKTTSIGMKRGEKFAVEQTSRYAQLLRSEDKLKDLNDRFNDFMRTSGAGDMTPQEFEKKLEQGELFVTKVDKKITQAYRDMNTRDVVEKLDLYEKFTQFKEEFIEAYGSDDESVNEDIRANIRDHKAFYRLFTKAYNSIDKQKAQIRDISDKELAENGADAKDYHYTVTTLQHAHDAIPMLKVNIEDVERLDSKAMDEKNKLFEERDALTDEIGEMEKNASENTYDAKLKNLMERRNGLVEEKEQISVKIASLEDTRKIQTNLKMEAYDKYEMADREQENYRKTAEENKAKYEKISGDIRNFEAFGEKYHNLRRMNDQLREKVRINRNGMVGKDILRNIKMNISSKLSGFNNTIECGRKKGHKNNPEFETMKNALKAFCDEDNGLNPTLSPLTYKNHLERIRGAAQAYLDKKNTEIRPIPSAMRKYRLDFAKRLIAFAEEAGRKIGEADEMMKNTDAHLRNAGIRYEPMSASDIDVFEAINQGVEKKQQLIAEHKLEAKKNDLDLQVGGDMQKVF